MNKEYTCVDGKVVVSSNSGMRAPIEYNDNIDAILIEENVIETMNKEISTLEKECRSYHEKNKKRFFPIFSPIFAFASIVCIPVLVYWIADTIMLAQANLLDVINLTKNLVLIFSSVMIPAGMLMDSALYLAHRNSIKEEKGMLRELEYLNDQLTKEKEKLENLKLEKKNEKEIIENKVIQVQDKEVLKAWRSWFDLYYDIGYNEAKYQKYYEKGILREKLEDKYEELGVNVVNNYFEENKSLTKKKF